MSSTASIVWFRQDLRIADQAALAAADSEGPWIGVYVLDDEAPGDWAIGTAQRWWLHHSLASLGRAVTQRGGQLVLRRGRVADEIQRVARAGGISRVHALRHYEPWWKAAEADIAAQLDLCLHEGNRLIPPAEVLNRAGGRYRIFTPYWRALKERPPPHPPAAAPPVLKAPRIAIDSEELSDWNLLPTKPNWAVGFAVWTPGEMGATDALEKFLRLIGRYDDHRDKPSFEATSRLSPHLHFGEISPATLWHRVATRRETGEESWLRQLAWRDFCANVADILPGYGDRNGRQGFEHLVWRSDAAADRDFLAWTRGNTGYPIVDAGMRELWATGFMHNRVRMIAASFLTKHLLIDWRRGERWFWDTLLDADYPNNAVNWQWVAGTGIDSNPFGRILAPLVQSRKFDAAAYIRRWVPALAALSDEAIHDPQGAGQSVPGYPEPLIGHRAGRERALAAIGRV